jgi:hypothetical protein
MEPQEQSLCEGCHEREAVHHSTTFIGNRVEERHLCIQCFEALASSGQLAEHRRISEIVARGKCKYCGQPAAGGSGCFSDPGEEEWDLWCEPCRQDLVEFDRRPENAIPEFDTSDPEQLKEAAQRGLQRDHRQAEFMHQRVRARLHR